MTLSFRLRIKAYKFLFLAIVAAWTLSCISAFPSDKRQGIFGLCQGWGAGCGIDYRSIPSGQTRVQTGSRRGSPAGSITQMSGGNYPFTSGGSWKPIGKRTAWFTDIPYLRNPLISFPRFRKPPGFQDYSRRYPLAYKSTFANRNPGDVVDQ